MEYIPAFLRDIMTRRTRVARVAPAAPPPPPLTIEERYQAYMKKKEDMEKFGDYLSNRQRLTRHIIPEIAQFNRDYEEFLRVNRDFSTPIAQSPGASSLYESLDNDALA